MPMLWGGDSVFCYYLSLNYAYRPIAYIAYTILHVFFLVHLIGDICLALFIHYFIKTAEALRLW